MPVERLDDGAKRAVSQARQAARDLEHDQVGTEHLLLGLMSEPDSDAARALRACGVSLEASRAKVAEAVANKRPGPGSAESAFTDRARLALERADRMSLRQGGDRIGTRHVLLSLLDVEGTAGQVLRGMSVDPQRVRREIERIGASAAGDDAPPAATAGPTVTDPRCPGCLASLEGNLAHRVMTAARAGSSPARIVVVFCSGCGTTIAALPG